MYRPPRCRRRWQPWPSTSDLGLSSSEKIKGQLTGGAAFTLSIKSVNHRFLDPHFRLPANTDALEMSLRKILKEKLARGHVDVNLSFEHGGGALMLNRQLVAAYVQAFRGAAIEAGIAAEPDLNAVLRLPGAFDSNAAPPEAEFTTAVLAKIDEVLVSLNRMREEGTNPPWLDELQRRYRVEAFPTLVVAAPDGREIAIAQGYAGKQKLLAFLQSSATAPPRTDNPAPAPR